MAEAIASAAAVASSKREALAMGRPVEFADQRLKIEQGFQPPLSNLRLIGV